MSSKLCAAFICCFLVLAVGCEPKSTADQNAAPPASSNSPASNAGVNKASGLDACTLIEKSEIASVQGREVQSAMPSGMTSGGLAVSQCYYAVISADGTKNLPVHIQVSEREANNKDEDAVKEFWEERFGERGESERERERKHERESERKREGKSEPKGESEGEREEGEESGPPLAVKGVGEEAFWMGNSKAGALYALKNKRIVRVSVGGPDEMEVKIEKSKTLAAKALKRLS